MKRYPWYKRDVDAWRGGTRSMSMELRGFYSECLDAMWDLQGPIPADVGKLAMMLCCNPRTVRKLLPQLVALGKLVQTADGYANPRMMADIGSTPIRSQLEPNSQPIDAELDAKVAKNSAKSTLPKEGEEDREEESPRARARRDQVWIEKGSVKVGSGLAAELAEKYPHAKLEQIVDAATMRLIGRRGLQPAEIEATVRWCAAWNDRDNTRSNAFRPPAAGKPSALEICRSFMRNRAERVQ